MKLSGLDFWPGNFSKTAISFAFAVSIGISVIFIPYAMPIGLLFAGLLIVILFFQGINYFSKKFYGLSAQKLDKQLFVYSLIFRLIFVGYLYLLTFILDPGNFPFEIHAADSWVYHLAGKKLAEVGFNDYWNQLGQLMKGRADYGYPVFLSLIYKLFGNITLPVRIVHALLGSFSIVLLARIARMLFSNDHARFTGIIAMLMPSLLWYTGLQLKETLMMYLVILAIYHAVKMLSIRRVKLMSIIFLVLSSFLLFFFRTFLAVLLISSIFLFYFYNKSRTGIRISVLVLFILGLLFLVNRYNIQQEVFSQYYESQNDYFNKSVQGDVINARISVKLALVTPFIISSAFVTPFPSFLTTETRQISIVNTFQNELVRNFMYYFYFVGLLLCFKKHGKKAVILIFFVMSYVAIVTFGGSSFQERFQLPGLPFIIILMSVGIVESKRSTLLKWQNYLYIILIAQVIWTLFKLNVRGLI